MQMHFKEGRYSSSTAPNFEQKYILINFWALYCKALQVGVLVSVLVKVFTGSSTMKSFCLWYLWANFAHTCLMIYVGIPLLCTNLWGTAQRAHWQLPSHNSATLSFTLFEKEVHPGFPVSLHIVFDKPFVSQLILNHYLQIWCYTQLLSPKHMILLGRLLSRCQHSSSPHVIALIRW